jgi:predicted chitinase
MSTDNFARLTAHVKKLAFWTEAEAGNAAANAKIKEGEKKSQEAYEAAVKKDEELKAKYEQDKLAYEADLEKKKVYDEAVKKKIKPLPEKPAGLKEPKEPALSNPVKPSGPRPTPGFVTPADCWHLPPRAFIEHMRKCLWLNKEELARIYPDRDYAGMVRTGFITDPSAVREKYRVTLNRAMSKYLIITPTRMTHFLGQGAVESRSLASMVEISIDPNFTKSHPSSAPETNGYYSVTDSYFAKSKYEGKNGNVDQGDGVKFRGRGMKQLTGRANYGDYWDYRGWLVRGKDFTHHWWDDQNRRDPAKRKSIPAPIPDPQRISLDLYSCIDTGGWYWTGSEKVSFLSINRFIKEGDISDATVFIVAERINGKRRQEDTGKIEPNGLPNRIKATRHVATIIMDTVK